MSKVPKRLATAPIFLDCGVISDSDLQKMHRTATTENGKWEEECKQHREKTEGIPFETVVGRSNDAVFTDQWALANGDERQITANHRFGFDDCLQPRGSQTIHWLFSEAEGNIPFPSPQFGPGRKAPTFCWFCYQTL
jgi:hypothetical protein